MRRLLATLVCAAPFVLAVASFASAADDGGWRPVVGLGLLALAALVAVLNAALSLRGGALLQWRSAVPTGKQHISGVPLLGTLLVVAGCAVGFGSLPCAGLGLACLVVDTGGAPWLLLATWWDDSFWNGGRQS